MRERKWLILLVAALLVFASGCLYVVDKEVIDEDGDINDGNDNGDVDDGDDNGDVNDGDDNGDVNDDDVVITLSAYASSEETGMDNDPAINVLDGDPNTKWHSDWSSGTAPVPHSITIVLSEVAYVDQLRYLPRQDFDWDGSHQWNGTIKEFEIQYSLDGETFETVIEGEWEWDRDSNVPEAKDWKEVDFAPVEAKEIRLVCHTSTNGDACAAEIELSYTAK